MRKGQLDAKDAVQEVLNLVAKLHGRFLIQFAEIAEYLVTEAKGAAHENLLVLCGDGKKLLMRHIVYVLYAYKFFLHLIEIVDEGAVACGTEKEGAVGLAEGLVLHVYGNGVRGLVLEGEAHVVLHAVAFFVFGLYLPYSLFKELLVLRGNGDGEVAGAVLVTHVFLGFHKVFSDGGAHLLGITVEFENALRLAAVCKAFFLEKGPQGLQAVFLCVFGLPKEFRGVECKVLYTGRKFCAGCIRGKVFPCLKLCKAAELVLEHAGGCAGSRDELGFAVDFGLPVICDGLCGGFLVKDFDAAFRGGGANNLHPGEALLEVLYLLFYGLERYSALLNLEDVFLV